MIILNKNQSLKIDLLVETAILSSGLLYKDTKVFYTNAFFIFIFICITIYSLQILISLLGFFFGKVVQNPELSKTPKYYQEIMIQTNSFLLTSFIAAFPYTYQQTGEVISYVNTLEESFTGNSIILNTLYIVLLLIFIDTYTYWKHWIFHTKHFFSFHEHHHAFSNPSVFSAFAVGPVETLMTFGLIYFQVFKISEYMQFYLPLHGSIIVMQILLNIYLHCGYSFDILENTLPKILINTSLFHNKHHEKTVIHLGELGTFWDLIMNTGATYYNKESFEKSLILKQKQRQLKLNNNNKKN